MIVASPRPIAAVSGLAPLLRLRADEIELHLQQPVQDSQTKMGMNPVTQTSSDPAPVPHLVTLSSSHSPNEISHNHSEVSRIGEPSFSASPPLPLMRGEVLDLEQLPPPLPQGPPPKYTRHSACTFPSFPSYPGHGHTAQPSTSFVSSFSMSSSPCSTPTARPSFESFTTPSDHGLSNQRKQRQKGINQKEGRMTTGTQGSNAAFQVHLPQSLPSPSPPTDNAPPYDSSFGDTNLSGFSNLSIFGLPDPLAHENLSALNRTSVFVADFDDLDRSDDRADPDSIVQRRLTRNALITRQSALTFASGSSVYSDATPSQAPPRDSVYSTYEDDDYDPARVSVQTYGSSVLTYGSRASQLLDGSNTTGSTNASGGNSASGGRGSGNGDGPGSSRPVAPLPWLPRPSALDRIQHSHLAGNSGARGRARSGSVGSTSAVGGGRRPLPPLPTPISASASPGSGPSSTLGNTLTRDRSVSLPSRSTSSGSNYSVSSASSSGARIGRRPRPLPRTPTSAISISTNLPNILEGEASESMNDSDSLPPSSGPVRSNSMFLSPTSASALASAAPLNFTKARARRSTSARYSTIGYGHVARAGVRGVFRRDSGSDEVGSPSEETSKPSTGVPPFQAAGVGGKVAQTYESHGIYGTYGRAASRASTRSTRSTYFVPDVDELVRILDSMDDGSANPSFNSGSGSGTGSSSDSALATPLVAEPWDPKFTRKQRVGENVEGKDDGEEEIDMGEALACSRSVVNVPCGKKRSGSSALEDLGFCVSVNIAKSNGTEIGLPTPAATPRSSPHRQPATLPSSSKPSSKPTPVPQPRPQSHAPFGLSKSTAEVEDAKSPTPSSATDALSLTSFPLPPIAPLCIPAPSALGADEIPIPSAASSAVPPSPSVVDIGKSPAERAMLKGMSKVDILRMPALNASVAQTQPWHHISARNAIADLKSRVSELPKFNFSAVTKKGGIGIAKLPTGVPLLGFPVPPHRRAQSTTNTFGAHSSASTMEKKHRQLPAIDVRAANALPPPSSFNVGKLRGSNSAPANNLAFEFDLEKPTIIYTTPAPAPPPVTPLRIRRTSSHSQTQKSIRVEAMKVQVLPASNTPQSASAAQTSFDQLSSLPDRPQRATSFCVSPSSPALSTVAPLRFKSRTKASPGLSARSSIIGAFLPLSLPEKQGQKPTSPDTVLAPMERKSSETDGSEESESDHLTTPTVPHAPLPNVVEPPAEDACVRGTGISVLSNGSFTALQHANGTHVSLDPAFADIIKSMASASEEEQIDSLLTIASSINTEHHTSGYNAGFFMPIVDENRTHDDDGFVDIDEEDDVNGLSRKETARKSIASGVSASERRRSKGRSSSSMKRRQSTRSAAAVRAAIRTLPDPSTFPVPDSGGSVTTNSSSSAAGADYASFGMRLSPFPKLRVVTRFKGGAVLLPASQAPLSATSTKSTMSTFGGGRHSRNASAVSVTAKRSSTTGAPHKMNRLTLTDPRSPMTDAAVAAATLVARVRQKRAALALRNRAPNIGSTPGGQNTVHIMQHGHTRTGSNSSATGTLRSKLKMSGSGFFGGSNVRTICNPRRVAVADTDAGANALLRSGPRVRRPTIRRMRLARTRAVVPKSGEVDLCA